MTSDFAGEACPCGLGPPYDECCGRLHRGEPARTAEALMRSRYTAFARKDSAYLAATWHPSTRPDPLSLNPSRRWRSLHVLSTRAGGLLDGDGEVEFVARWEDEDGTRGRHHERSRFTRDADRWVYVDAVTETNGPGT